MQKSICYILGYLFIFMNLFGQDYFCFNEAAKLSSKIPILMLDGKNQLSLGDFYEVVYKGKQIQITSSVNDRLDETRQFVDYLLKKNIKVYGLTTGFADLRNSAVSPCEAGLLSKNIILSHDAGIGKSLPREVVLGAMFLRVHSLAQGNSAIKKETLQTLVDMINSRIVPLIPNTGSLGASGDLAFLARLGRAMCGEDVPVYYQGKMISAKEALAIEGITPFQPSAKEGLALTNGTSFMASMLAVAYLKQMHEWENILALQNLFLSSIKAVDAAFNESINKIRKQKGQQQVAKILLSSLKDSPFLDRKEIQNDYCIRCLPQILGPKIEILLSLKDSIVREMNAVTDNPLIFCDEEISSDISAERIIPFKGKKWVVLSGGNFHGEYIATIADILAMLNAKIALTMDRQMTYMLNPWRNGNILPTYLIYNNKKVGLMSGYMITQYALNAIVQKICHLASPVSNFNLTSANESEDVVSYGASSAHKLLKQLEQMRDVNVIYLATVMQAYAIQREKLQQKQPLSSNILSEKLFKTVSQYGESVSYPIYEEVAFDKIYRHMGCVLEDLHIRALMDFPLVQEVEKKQLPHLKKQLQ